MMENEKKRSAFSTVFKTYEQFLKKILHMFFTR